MLSLPGTLTLYFAIIISGTILYGVYTLVYLRRLLRDGVFVSKKAQMDAVFRTEFIFVLVCLVGISCNASLILDVNGMLPLVFKIIPLASAGLCGHKAIPSVIILATGNLDKLSSIYLKVPYYDENGKIVGEDEWKAYATSIGLQLPGYKAGSEELTGSPV